MTTKQLGNIGEAKALAKFVELQIPVYIPFGDNEKSDLIADFNGKLNKIQVKTSEEWIDSEKFVISLVSLVSSTMHRNSGTFPLQGNRGVRIPHVSTIFYKLEFYIERVL